MKNGKTNYIKQIIFLIIAIILLVAFLVLNSNNERQGGFAPPQGGSAEIQTQENAENILNNPNLEGLIDWEIINNQQEENQTKEVQENTEDSTFDLEERAIQEYVLPSGETVLILEDDLHNY